MCNWEVKKVDSPAFAFCYLLTVYIQLVYTTQEDSNKFATLCMLQYDPEFLVTVSF